MGLGPILVYPNCCHKTLLTAYEQQALSSLRVREAGAGVVSGVGPLPGTFWILV